MDFVDVNISSQKQLADDNSSNLREEVKLIENPLNLSGEKDKARDLFLIGIYSGQRLE